jgi:hypothetical protein
MRPMRLLAAVHRYLGAALCVVLFTWFVSGIVMMYAGYPVLGEGAKLERMPRLDWSAARIPVAEAAGAAAEHGAVEYVRLGMLLGRPAYFIYRGGSQWTTVYADDGRVAADVDPDQATAIAQQFFPDGGSVRRVDLLSAADQWTVYTAWAPYLSDNGFSNGFAPMYKLEFADAAATALYVLQSTGDVVGRTTQRERIWGYLGAVVHWIYPTSLRVQAVEIWDGLIVWTSALGALACAIGLVLGVYYLDWGKRGRLSPYKGMLAWHHYLGLVFGLVACTWLFSGFMSMDPWSWSPTELATYRTGMRGGALALDRFTLPPNRALDICGARFAVKEIRLTPVQGRPYYQCIEEPHQTLLVSADASAPAIHERFGETTLVAAAQQLIPDGAIVDAAMLDDYDAYYYPSWNDRFVNAGRKPLPILRLVFDDDDRTFVYVNPASGAPSLAYGSITRMYRWLFNGLHSLSIPGLYASRPLWDGVMLFVMLGGSVLSLTGIWIGVVWLRRVTRTTRERGDASTA